MIPEIGNFTLNFASLCCFIIILLPLVKLLGANRYFIKATRILIIAQFILFTLTIAILAYCFIISDTTVLLVAKHSHQLMPLLYKITGLWGNHEGSMLLWCWELSFITLLFLLYGNYEPSFKSKVLALQALIIALISIFIIFYSNPFVRIFIEKIQARGLNPLLQDIGLASHPPLLYAGYVGFSIPYSISMIALITGDFSSSIAKNMRIWCLTAWGFLSLGIVLGSLWAYRELGWGGFWFWDPVENASLMPWIMGVCLLHSLILWQKRSIAINWSILLSIACFCLSIFGTFLVRSNLIVSVHSFASDATRGVVILQILAFFTILSLVFYGIYQRRIISESKFGIISKDITMLLNNIFASTACFTIIIATLYPIFYQYLTDKSITIGSGYFSSIFIPIIMPNILLASIGPNLNWAKDKLNISKTSIFSIIIISTISYLCSDNQLSSFIYMFCGIFLLWQMILRKKISAMTISHSAIAILVIAITILTIYEETIEQSIKPGESISFYDNKYKIHLENISYEYGKNYLIRKAEFKVNNDLSLSPEARYYPVEESSTTECAIYSTIKGDLYISIGDYDEKQNSITVRIHYKPMMIFVWVGGFMLFIGAVLGVFKKLSN